MEEDKSIRNTINFVNCISNDSDYHCFQQIESDENFYKNTAAQFIEAALTVMIGIAIYKVKPRQ